MDVDAIKKLITLMNEHSLTEIDYEKDGVKICLKKGSDDSTNKTFFIGGQPQHQAGHHVSAAPPAIAVKTVDPDIFEVKSPLVGTFYRSPNPEAPAFVEVGTKVAKGKTLCIVEAMKVMNEIQTDVDGVVEEVLANNSEAVEFNQVLFKIRKNKAD